MPAFNSRIFSEISDNIKHFIDITFIKLIKQKHLVIVKDSKELCMCSAIVF